MTRRLLLLEEGEEEGVVQGPDKQVFPEQNAEEEPHIPLLVQQSLKEGQIPVPTIPFPHVRQLFDEREEAMKHVLREQNSAPVPQYPDLLQH